MFAVLVGFEDTVDGERLAVTGYDGGVRVREIVVVTVSCGGSGITDGGGGGS